MRLMRRRKRWILGTAIAVAVLGVGGGVGAAAYADSPTADDDKPITGTALTRATEAALAHTKGGTVSDTETGDEQGTYEVEVTMPDGREVEVLLDANFAVTGTETDDDKDETDDDKDETDDTAETDDDTDETDENGTDD